MEETYRAERKVIIFSIILGIVIFVSMLSFFGVIGDGPKSSFGCSLPKHFECSNLIITKDSIDFDVSYPIGTLTQLNIKPEAGTTCKEILTNGMEAGSTLHITIKCGSTSSKGDSYKLSFDVDFTEDKRLEKIEKGSVKGKVT